MPGKVRPESPSGGSVILRSVARAIVRRWRSALVAAVAAFLAGLLFLPGAPLASTARARLVLRPGSPWTPARAADVLLSDEVLSAALATSRPEDIPPYRALFRTRLEGASVRLESTAVAGGSAVRRVNAVARAFAERAPRVLEAERAAEAARLDAAIAARTAELAALPRPAPGRAASHPEAVAAAEEALRRLDAELARRTADLESGATGPVRAVDTSASDALAAQLDAARRRRDALQALYPADWPPVARAAAEIEDLRLRLQQARNREGLEARFAPVREALERVRTLSAERERVRLELETLAAARPAAPSGDPGAKRASLDAHLRELEENRARLLSSPPAAAALVDRVEPAAGAVESRSTLPLLAGLSLLAGLLTAWIRERLDATIRTEHDIRRFVNLPVLGVIPQAPREDDRMLLHADPHSRLVEPFNTAAALLEGHAADVKAKTIAVVSARPGDGKSTVAANLAVSLARGLARVLLVDADLRRPSQHRFFGLGDVPGLSSYLTGASDSLDSLIASTEMENLTILPAGPTLQNPIPFLRSERLRVVLPELRERFDFVIVDLPPVRSAADALVLMPALDGAVLVLGAGATGKDDAAAAKRLVRDARGRFLGCVLNKAAIHSRGYYEYVPATVPDAR
jgi:capsular exopolysaccharide synthesis family protein